MAKIIVTGASGFIGKALVRALSRTDHQVIPVRHEHGDITDPTMWAALPSADHVIHLAGRSFVPDSWSDAASFIHINVDGTARALEYCRARGAHLVFVSAYVYGAPRRLPIREDDPVDPNNPYALSKVLAEQVCQFYASSMNVPVTVLRPFNVFGPGQSQKFLIPMILEQVLGGGPIRVRDLAPRRDYLFLDDLVTGLVKALAAPAQFRVFNIGSGQSYSVREIIESIQSAAGTKLPVLSDDQPRVNEIADTVADITRARELLDWRPRYTFVEGIEHLLEESFARAR